MRFLKLALISIVVLFIILTAISLLIPSIVVVSRSTEVNKSKELVLPMITRLDQWPTWLEQKEEVKLVRNAHGNQPSVLQISNTTVMLEKADNREVRTVWQTGRGKQMESVIYILPGETSSVTRLQWQSKRHLRWYPWEKFSSIALEKVLGPYIEKNLLNIKTIAER